MKEKPTESEREFTRALFWNWIEWALDEGDLYNTSMDVHEYVGSATSALRTQLSASQKRCEELELFIHATTAANEMAAPLYVQDEPERGKGWACYYHDERYLFIPADERGLPVIDESIRAELERARMRTSQP